MISAVEASEGVSPVLDLDAAWHGKYQVSDLVSSRYVSFLSDRSRLRAFVGDAGGTVSDIRVIADYLDLFSKRPNSTFDWLIFEDGCLLTAEACWRVSAREDMDAGHLMELEAVMADLESSRRVELIRAWGLAVTEVHERCREEIGTVTALPLRDMSWDRDWSWEAPEDWFSHLEAYWWQLRPAGFPKAEAARALRWMDRAIYHDSRGMRRVSWTPSDIAELARKVERENVLRETTGNGSENRLAYEYGRVFPMLAQRRLQGDTVFRIVRTALAAERYRRAHDDYPGSVGDLVPRWIDAVPVHAGSGMPLTCGALPEGRWFTEAPGVDAETTVRWIR